MKFLAKALMAGLLISGPADSEPVVTFFDWTTDRCARWDIPDAPARFWRDDANSVRMIASAEVARSSRGPDLSRLHRNCRVHFEGSGDPDPSRRDDRVWIASLHTRDGRRIDAIGHAEFHGHDHPDTCDAATYMPCWRNALIALESRDGGDTFQRTTGAPLAALPYPYDRSQTRRSGYFNPSNMIERAGFVYVYFFAEAYKAQRRGVCLARRPTGTGPDAWRFWDGAGFSGRFADPYAHTIDRPQDHVCTPLSGLSATLSSVVFQPVTGRYLAVSPMTRDDARGARKTGIWALQSRDLVHWGDAVLLAELPLLWARDCAQRDVHAYPSLIDPDSPDRNFTTVDDQFWLTFARMKLDPQCRTGPDRDLVGIEINWPETRMAAPAVPAPSPARPDRAR